MRNLILLWESDEYHENLLARTITSGPGENGVRAKKKGSVRNALVFLVFYRVSGSREKAIKTLI